MPRQGHALAIDAELQRVALLQAENLADLRRDRRLILPCEPRAWERRTRPTAARHWSDGITIALPTQPAMSDSAMACAVPSAQSPARRTGRGHALCARASAGRARHRPSHACTFGAPLRSKPTIDASETTEQTFRSATVKASPTR